MANVADMLRWGQDELAFLGSEEARASAERLLSAVLARDRTGLYLEARSRVSEDEAGAYREFVGRRKKRVPVAYILRRTDFWNETLTVGPGCLIPRPETEILVECFLETAGFGRDSSFSFLDLGCGTGAIGIAILREFPEARAVFSDVAPEALEIAGENLEHYSLKERAETVASDLFSGLAGRSWDAIVSNPPYLSEADWKGVEPEILCEPRAALDGGRDGLDFYRRIVREAPGHLNPGGRIFVETGLGQAPRVAGWLREARFSEVEIFQDHGGIERVVKAHLLP